MSLVLRRVLQSVWIASKSDDVDGTGYRQLSNNERQPKVSNKFFF